MHAALNASDETVSLLLFLGANADKTDDGGISALMAAIQSKCISTINLLAPTTNVNLEGALNRLIKDKIQLKSQELQLLLQRAAQDKVVAVMGVANAATYGSNDIIDMIGTFTNDHSIFKASQQKLLMQAVRCDREATVSAILRLLPKLLKETETEQDESLPLPPGWNRRLAPHGRVFFVDHLNKKVS